MLIQNSLRWILAVAVGQTTLLTTLAKADPVDVQSVAPISWGDHQIGFSTSDSDVEFFNPDAWGNRPQSTLLEQRGDNQYTLSMVLEPQFTQAAAYVQQMRVQGSRKHFLPLPYVLESSDLFFDSVLGGVEARVEPNPVQNQSPFVYYKLTLDDDGLQTLRALALSQAGGLSILGAVTYRYQHQGETQTTSAPIRVTLTEEQLRLRVRPADYGLEWIKHLLDERGIFLPGVLDGEISLGLMSIHIDGSTGTGSLSSAASLFSATPGRVSVVATRSNFAADLKAPIRELGVDLEVHVDFEVDMIVDMLAARITVNHLRVVHISGSAGDLNDFYRGIIDRLINEPNSLARLNDQLTQEFRYRILNGSLFI